MAELKLRFLGQFQVTLNEQPITAFESDKVRALLAYVAVETTRAHSREALTALLWPDYEASSARGSLRQALYQLRQVINTEGAAPDCLLVTRQTIQLNPAAALTVDVATFTHLLQTTTNHAHTALTTCAVCLQQLQEAVALYQGEFLAGFAIADSAPFEEWRRSKQELCHLQALDALTTLANSNEATGAWEQAQHYARRQLALEPWHEEAHRQLMRLLVRQGQRAAAVAQYQTCRQVLQMELGIEPSTATTHLYEQIRVGLLPEQAVPVAVPAAPLSPVAPPVPPTHMAVAEPIHAERCQRRHNLPTSLTPFIGRVREVAEITAQLQQPECRLLTLIGPGGMGKTRLALEVARTRLDHYADGVFFISLAPLTSAAALVPAIITALELDLPGATAEKSLLHFLRSKQMLLIFDNVEHLPNAVSTVITLVEESPGVQMMVTSRARLNLQGEQLYPVQPLLFQSVASLEAGLATDAVRLFSACARRINPAFTIDATTLPAVLRICQLVEGMPLGLEMAAAQSEWLALAEIAREIEVRSDFLATDWADVPVRQRSMRAVFAWSWDLLNAQDQQTFSHLSIFRGGFTREAATAIIGAPLRSLINLVNKSLLYVSYPQPTAARYQVHELLRQFGAEQLAAQPVARAAVEARHSTYYLTFLAEREERLARHEPRQAAAEIQQELDNIRSAWAHAAATVNIALLACSANALMRYYELTGLLDERIQEFQRAVSALDVMPQPVTDRRNSAAYQSLRSKLLAFLASALMKQGKFDEGMTLAQRAIDLGQAHGGREGEVYGWLILGQGFYRKGYYNEARGQFSQVLRLIETYQPHNSALSLLDDVEYMAHGWLGATESETGNFATAKTAFAQGIARCRRLNNPRAEVQWRINLANLLHHMSDYVAARTLYEECLQVTHDLGYHWGEGETLAELGNTLAMLGEYTLADAYLRRAEDQLARFGYTVEEIHCTLLRVRLHCYLGAYPAARQWLGHVFQSPLLQESAWLTLMARLTRATLAYQTGDYGTVVDDTTVAQQLSERLGTPLLQANGRLLLGHAYAALHAWDAAADAYTQANRLYQQLGNLMIGAEAVAGLALVALASGKTAQACYQIETILPLLQNNNIVGLHEPFFITLAIYRVLTAVADQRAVSVLASGYAQLQRYANQIADTAMQQSFWEAVPIHHELHQVYTAMHQAMTVDSRHEHGKPPRLRRDHLAPVDHRVNS